MVPRGRKSGAAEPRGRLRPSDERHPGIAGNATLQSPVPASGLGVGEKWTQNVRFFPDFPTDRQTPLSKFSVIFHTDTGNSG